MEAIGLLETKGLVLAIDALDIMLKTANVSLLKKEIVGGGLVAMVLTGSVSDVTTAIDAGVSSCKKKGFSASSLVIPRCDEDVYQLLQPAPKYRDPQLENLAHPDLLPVREENQQEMIVPGNESCEKNETKPSLPSPSPLYTEDHLLSLTVKQLRKLYRELALEHSPNVASMSKKTLICELLKI